MKKALSEPLSGWCDSRPPHRYRCSGGIVWARIVESEKPVFTVMFGGAAAFATAISEAAKHL
jgi:hypothetical protein